MKLIFDVLWLVGGVGFVAGLAWGWVAKGLKARMGAFAATMCAALVAAAQGWVVFAGFAMLFPCGLGVAAHMLRGVEGDTLPNEEWLPLWWVYAGLGALYLVVTNATVRRGAWIVLGSLLVLNIGGCWPFVASLRGISG